MMINSHLWEFHIFLLFPIGFLSVPTQTKLLKLSQLTKRAKLLKILALPPLLSLWIFKTSFELSIFIPHF